jgi:hypothetical protein
LKNDPHIQNVLTVIEDDIRKRYHAARLGGHLRSSAIEYALCIYSSDIDDFKASVIVNALIRTLAEEERNEINQAQEE